MLTDERSGGRPTTVRPGSIVPPPCSTRSSATRWAAGACSSVSTPRSLRLDASDGSLCRRTLRPIVGGSKCAASMTMSVVFSSISTWAAPITPAMPTGPPSSVMSRSSGSSVRTTSSRVVIFSPPSARRTTMSPWSLARS